MITTTILRIRAARGLAWMEENAKEYDLDVTRVDIEELDMRNNQRCVLGQACRWKGGFEVIADLVGDGDYKEGNVWLRHHGFDLAQDVEDTNGAWERLCDVWIDLLREDAKVKRS